MVYCSKCGKKNEDDAEFCAKCGASLTGVKVSEKEWDKRCDEECHGGGRGGAIFWGIIIILVGLWIIFEFVLKNIAETVPALKWVETFPFFWIFALVIGVFVIAWGIRIVSKR